MELTGWLSACWCLPRPCPRAAGAHPAHAPWVHCLPACLPLGRPTAAAHHRCALVTYLYLQITKHNCPVTDAQGIPLLRISNITCAAAPLQITKHNFLVMDVKDIPRVIKEAFYLARTGRPGKHFLGPLAMLLAMLVIGSKGGLLPRPPRPARVSVGRLRCGLRCCLRCCLMASGRWAFYLARTGRPGAQLEQVGVMCWLAGVVHAGQAAADSCCAPCQHCPAGPVLDDIPKDVQQTPACCFAPHFTCVRLHHCPYFFPYRPRAG